MGLLGIFVGEKSCFSEHGNAVAVDQTFDLYARFTQGTFTVRMGFIVGNIVAVVNAADGESFAFFGAGENRAE